MNFTIFPTNGTFNQSLVNGTINSLLHNSSLVNGTLNPLLHNSSCESPHSETAKIYTYTLNNEFVGVSTFFAIVNFIAILPTILLNFAIILCFIRQRELRTTSNRLLFSICLADFTIGAAVEPIFGVHIIQITNGSHECGLSNFLIYTVPVLIVITMVTHMAISLERYFGLHYPKQYIRIFTKRLITWLMVLIWTSCLFCFILPFLTGNPILGTRIIVCFILVSLAVSSYCYISMYQDYKWRNGKPTVTIEGAYIIRSTEIKERSDYEQEQFEKNIKLCSFFSKLFLCMLIFYILNLVKNTLNSYDIFEGNGHYIVHFLFDTILFMNALINPFIILYCSPDISVSMVFCWNKFTENKNAAVLVYLCFKKNVMEIPLLTTIKSIDKTHKSWYFVLSLKRQLTWVYQLM